MRGRLRAAASSAGGVALFLAACTAAAVYGDTIWRTMAPSWPGGGHGFAAAAGFALIVSWSTAGLAFRSAVKLGRPLSRQAVAYWCVSATATAVAVLPTVTLAIFVPGRNGMFLGSVHRGEPMWVEAHWEVCLSLLAGLGVGAALMAVVALVTKPGATGRRRREPTGP
ncbi:hypothetical protein [Streptomyces armeniacus]|uniref:hypothetical protein n=1 Tax=Streptomyces armeniacus TaxID=83291 RepID=UPI001AD84219|nr:hypothetical protein [Streptomyces armeniacus]